MENKIIDIIKSKASITKDTIKLENEWSDEKIEELIKNLLNEFQNDLKVKGKIFVIYNFWITNKGYKMSDAMMKFLIQNILMKDIKLIKLKFKDVMKKYLFHLSFITLFFNEQKWTVFFDNYIKKETLENICTVLYFAKMFKYKVKSQEFLKKIEKELNDSNPNSVIYDIIFKFLDEKYILDTIFPIIKKNLKRSTTNFKFILKFFSSLNWYYANIDIDQFLEFSYFESSWMKIDIIFNITVDLITKIISMRKSEKIEEFMNKFFNKIIQIKEVKNKIYVFNLFLEKSLYINHYKLIFKYYLVLLEKTDENKFNKISINLVILFNKYTNIIDIELLENILTLPKKLNSLQFKLWFLNINKIKLVEYNEKINKFYNETALEHHENINKNSLKKIISIYPYYICGLVSESYLNKNKNTILLKNNSLYLFKPEFFKSATYFEINFLFSFLNNIVDELSDTSEDETYNYCILYFNCIVKNNLNFKFLKDNITNVFKHNILDNILIQLVLLESKVKTDKLKMIMSLIINNLNLEIKISDKSLLIISYFSNKYKINQNKLYDLAFNTNFGVEYKTKYNIFLTKSFIFSDNIYKRELFSKMFSLFFLFKNNEFNNIIEVILNENVSNKIYLKDEIIKILGNNNLNIENLFDYSKFIDLLKYMNYIDNNVDFYDEELDLISEIEEFKKYDNEEQELSIYHKKDELDEVFGVLIKQISYSLEELFDYLIKNDKNNLDNLFLNNFYENIYPLIVKLSISDNVYNSYFINLLNKSSSYLFLEPKLNNFFNKNSYNALRYEHASSDLKLLEDELSKEGLEKYIKLKYSYSFFKEFIIFVFEALFDMNSKRNCFYILTEIVKINNKYDFIFKFIIENMNSLYFDNIEILILNVINIICDVDKYKLDDLLKNLLNYQDFARKIILNVLLKLNPSIYKNSIIQPINKINIMILTKVDNEEINKLALELIVKNPNIKLNIENILDINFKEMLINYPFDMHLMYNKIIHSILEENNDKKKDEFIDHFSKESLEIINRIKNKELLDVEDLEDKIKFIPKLIDHIKQQLNKNSLIKGISLVMELEDINFENLSENSLKSLINIIKNREDIIDNLLVNLKNNLSQENKTIFPIILIGKCVQIRSIKNNDLEKKIFDLLLINDIEYHKKLSKFLPFLIPMFSKPKAFIEKLLKQTKSIKDENEIKCNLLFMSGLIKGFGIKYLLELDLIGDIQTMIKNSKKKNLGDIDNIKKVYMINTLSSLWHIFKKLLEPLFSEIMEIIIIFFSEYKENIRVVSVELLNKIMKDMSGYGIKICLPILLKGCQSDKNTSSRINSISALKCIAYLGTKQLSNNLPILVPELTKGTIDSNLDIKKQSIDTLEIILSTIKNPEISNMKEFIVKSLTNPYEDNWRALEVLLNINFMHYFDTSSLSLIIPIILYGLNNERNSKSRKMAAQVLANISHLIKNDDDILIYFDDVIIALKSASSDLLSDVRATVAKSIASLCKRFGNKIINSIINTFKEILENEKSTSISKAGAAQCFSEALNYLEKDKQKEIILNCLLLTKDKNLSIKESFISIFVYLPIIMDKNYLEYIKDTIDNIINSLSIENEKIRSMAIKSIKGIIQKFYKDKKDVIINPLLKTSFSNNYVKRYSSLILIGDLIETLYNSSNLKDKEKLYEDNKNIFSLLYIMKNDKDNETRNVSINIWKIFVNNPGKTLKLMHSELIHMIINLSISESEYHVELFGFVMHELISKYGDNLMKLIIEDLMTWKKKCDILFLKGICHFIKHMFLNLKKDLILKYYEDRFKILIIDLFNIDDREILNLTFNLFETFLKKTKKLDLAIEMLTYNFEILYKIENEDIPQKPLDVIENFLYYKIPNLKTIIFENVLKNEKFYFWKIDILRNCADIFGSRIFKDGMLKDGVSYFYNEYIKYDENLREIFLSTIKNLILHVDETFDSKLINELTFNLKNYNSKDNNDGMLFYLEIVNYLFEKSEMIYFYRIELIDSLMEIFYNTNINERIEYNLGKVFEHISSDLFNNQWRLLAEKLKIFLTLEKHKKSICYNNQEIMTNLLNICLEGIKIGNKEIIYNLIKAAKSVIRNADKAIINKYLKKIYGSLVRTLSYDLEVDVAEKLLKFLKFILKSFPIGSFFDNMIFILVNNLNNLDKEEKDVISNIFVLIEKLFSQRLDRVNYIKFWKLRCFMEPECDLKNLENFISVIQNKEMKEKINKEFELVTTEIFN